MYTGLLLSWVSRCAGTIFNGIGVQNTVSQYRLPTNITQTTVVARTGVRDGLGLPSTALSCMSADWPSSNGSVVPGSSPVASQISVLLSSETALVTPQLRGAHQGDNKGRCPGVQ